MPPRVPPANQAAAPPASHEANGHSRAALADNLNRVRERMAVACEQAGRRPESVTLVAVTKYAAPEQIRTLLSLGVGDLGENYVQQLAQRAAQLGEYYNRRVAGGDANMPKALRWHMIGHLQRNKAKQLLPAVAMIQTLDSLRLAEELDAQTEKLHAGTDHRLPVLLQINATEEGQKGGVAVGASVHLAEHVATMPRLRLMGVMTMARQGANEKETRHTFARCREIFEEMRTLKIAGDDLRHLSMGMSDDFEAAILEGSTIVRIGSALFGGGPERDGENPT